MDVFGLILMGDVYIENLLTINKEKKDKNVSPEIVYVFVLKKKPRVWLIFLEKTKKSSQAAYFKRNLAMLERSQDKAYRL